MQTKKQIVSQFFDDYLKKTVTETETAITIAEESATITAYNLYQSLLKLHKIRTQNSIEK